MSAPLNKFLLLSLGGGVLVTPAMAYDPPPPLQQKLHALQCATDAKSAQEILKTLNNITPPGQQWPDEWLGQKSEPSLHAGLLDIALDTLKSTAERFPDLREEAERIALQWGYCEVLEDQKLHDLILRQKKLYKMLAADETPLKSKGFREWGFLTPDPAKRFVPKLLDEIRIAPEAYHLFLHEIYRKRCFPHPATGLLVSEAEAPSAAVSNHALTLTEIPEEIAQAYPFKWDNTCQVIPAKQPATSQKKALPSKKEAPTTKPKATLPKKTAEKTSKVPLASNKAERKKQREIRQQTRQAQQQSRETQVTPTTSPPLILSLPTPTPPSQAALGAKGEVGKAAPPPTLHTAKEQMNLPAVIPIAAGGDIPIYIEDEEKTASANQQAHSTTGIIGTDKNRKNNSKKKKLRLAGSFANTVSLKDGKNSLSASATWSPKPNWFVSGNASLKEGEVGYSWSAGYADYKPGGMSAQVNNWGPIKPGEGLALDKAVVNIGKKIKSEKLTKHKLAASTNLSIPVKGKRSLSGTMQWNPKPNVYTRATASVPLEGGKPNWNYVVGYSSPKPGGVKIEYANYDKNQFPGDNLKDGAITVSRSWQF